MLTDRHAHRPGRPAAVPRGVTAPVLVLVALLVAALAACSSAEGAGGSDPIAAGLPESCRATAGTSAPPTLPVATTEPAFAPSSIAGERDGSDPATDALVHLRGRVIDGRCRNPIEGAGVFLFAAQDPSAPIESTVADADGHFDVEVPRDRYRVAFHNAGLNYDFTWYPTAADFAGADEVALRADTDLGDLELFHPEDQPVAPYEGEGTRNIVVVGDSLVQQSTTPIARKLDLIGPTSVRGIANQRIDQMQPTAERYAAMAPDTVVIALGSNDANQDHRIEESWDALQRMLDTFDGAHCIVLVDLNTRTPRPDFNVRATMLNAMLTKVAADRPVVHVAPWDHAVEVLLTLGPSEVWFTDGLHLTQQGIEVYARLMADAVNSC